MVINMQEYLEIIKDMIKEFYINTTEMCMKGNGQMIYLVNMESIVLKMEIFMKDSI